MIELYYTGARNQLDDQTKPYTSLGGYVSRTKVPNGQLSNLFGGISEYAKSIGMAEVLALAIKNADPALAVESLFMWFTYPDDASSLFEIAVAAIDPDTIFMEEVSSNRALPFNASEFHQAVEGDALEFTGGIPAGGYLGLWIKRIVDPSEPFECELPTVEEEPSTEDDIGFVIDFTMETPASI